jgi:hypothetical protein
MVLNSTILKFSTALFVILLNGSLVFAQVPKKMPKQQPKKAVTDTLKKKTSSDTTKGKSLKSYAELLKKAKTSDGLFKVHQINTDFYFELPLKMMDKDFLIVNKISSVPLALNESGLNKGMNFENKVIRFSRNKLANTIWVKTIVPKVQSAATDFITRSVNDNFTGSVIESFKIEAYSADSSTVVIKMNRIFDGTDKSFNDVFADIGLGTAAKASFSAIEHIKSFPQNIVVRSLLSTRVKDGQNSIPISVTVTTNLVLLPENPMKPRFADKRVGFFTTPMWYFSDSQQKMETRELVTRWRMEPKPEDRARYLKGELVEPVKPILFYIDPATPAQWRKHIIAGVADWQKTFEAAGFKNAIVALEVTDTADYDGDDIRYSEITYAASPKANAMGPSVIDPRTGEILEADVVWWHNVMTAVHSWMRVQTGVIDADARKNVLPEDKMGHAIRFVSSHEIGHTLGLKHNMGSSAAFPVDSLRSPTFTKRMAGTAPSIMDYARFNYVAQPGDKVYDITPKIGVYDKYAISWAYRWLPFNQPHEELDTLRKWISIHANDPLYRFGEQQSSLNVVDPRSQSEDLGDDAVKASRYGLANLKRMIPQILDWSAPEGEDFYEAGKLYMAALRQWQTYAEHVTANIGGYYLENPVAGDQKNSYTPVPVAMQKNALNYLKQEVFMMPEWLFPKELLLKTFPIKDTPLGPFEYAPYTLRREFQYGLMYSLFQDERLLRMMEIELLHGKDNVFSVEELFKQSRSAIFEKTLKGKALSITERMLQQNYIDVLLVSTDKTLEKITKKSVAAKEDELRTIYVNSMSRTADVVATKRGELLQILAILEKKKNSGDQSTKNHYNDLTLRIRQSLKIN